MLIELTREFYENKVKPKLRSESNIIQQANKVLRPSTSYFDINVTQIEFDELDLLYSTAQEEDNRSLMTEIAKIRNLLEDVSGKKITSVRALAAALVFYFSTDVIDGWLYHAEDGVANPYLIKSVKYFKGSKEHDEKQSVSVELIANSAKGTAKDGAYITSLHFESDDTHGKTIPELLMSRGYFHETKQLRALYNDNLARFNDYQPQHHKQFWIEGWGIEQFDYRNGKFKMERAKAVNDEDILTRKFSATADPKFWRDLELPEHFDEVPFHCYVYLFHLNLHKNVWVHVQDMQPYVYNPSLKDKLVLPQEHSDLIDMLVEDMDVLQEDIIEGKSGGTTILCTGTPGLGKTLSAEVYSEVIGRPLYCVHSGQLGLNAKEVEKNLEIILKRSERWGAVLLIDEADVYIRSRGTDLNQNAVAAAFLRTLEYFSGLLFMTTNRGEDVDDAIVSRCIAIIKYKTPTPDLAERLWVVLSQQMGVPISNSLIADLIVKFPEASGRDIKQLLKLTSRWVKHKNLDYSVEAFRQCAQFKGII